MVEPNPVCHRVLFNDNDDGRRLSQYFLFLNRFYGTPSMVKAIREWKKRRWPLIFPLLASLSLLLANPLSTLYSIRQIPDTNVYVMDYYGDYNLAQIKTNGMDPRNIEDSFIQVLFPKPLAVVVKPIKRIFIPEKVNAGGHHCSTVTLKSKQGDAVYFGRNFDWFHDAALIIRVHDSAGLASIAVIDLHYLNLDRPDVHKLSIFQRLPLLFAPYYVMDGINRHGLAISQMTVRTARAPRPRNKPRIIYPTLARVILDYAKTTPEAIQLFHEFQIYFPYTNIHFMLADASGDSRIVEFIGGKLRVTPMSGHWQLCTNSIVWNKSERQKNWGCRRYRRGATYADQLRTTNLRSSKLQPVISEKEAIRVTRSMAVKDYTMWTSVYELKSLEFLLFYKTQPEIAYRDSIPRIQEVREEL